MERAGPAGNTPKPNRAVETTAILGLGVSRARPLLVLPIRHLWIVGISNAFNLLDNKNGLAAGVAISSAFIFFLNALALEEIFLCLILAALAGVLADFQRQNLYPARILMGDWGALFIGFMLSSLTILEHYVSPASSSLFPVLMLPLVLAVPLMDTALVIFIRVSEGRPIYRDDRCHLSHRLVAAGVPEPQAVKLLPLLTLALGMGALQPRNASVARSLWTIAYTSILAALVLGGIGGRGAARTSCRRGPRGGGGPARDRRRRPSKARRLPPWPPSKLQRMQPVTSSSSACSPRPRANRKRSSASRQRSRCTPKKSPSGCAWAGSRCGRDRRELDPTRHSPEDQGDGHRREPAGEQRVHRGTGESLPSAPVKPQPLKNLIVALVLGLGSGCGFVLFRDYLDNSLKEQEGVEKYLKADCLAIIPKHAVDECSEPLGGHVGEVSPEPAGAHRKHRSQKIPGRVPAAVHLDPARRRPRSSP